MTRLRGAAAVLASVVACAVGACRSAPSIEPGTGLNIVRDLEASASIRASDLYSALTTEATFAVVAGKEEGTTRTWRRSATDKHGAAIKEELSGARVEFLRMNDQGQVVMPAVIDHANNALSLFDPPMVVLPAELTRDEPFTARSAMRVVDAGNSSKQKERGAAERTVTYIGDRLLNTPIGEIRCHQLQVIFTADLRMADAETRTTLYVSPEYGLVAEQWSEVVKVFGALSSEKGEVTVLASEPK